MFWPVRNQGPVDMRLKLDDSIAKVGTGPSSYDDRETSAALLTSQFKTINHLVAQALSKHMNPDVRFIDKVRMDDGQRKARFPYFSIATHVSPSPGPNKLNWTGKTGSAHRIYARPTSPERTHTSTLPARWILSSVRWDIVAPKRAIIFVGKVREG